MTNWSKFRKNAGSYAGKAYTLGSTGLILKSFVDNIQDVSQMVTSESILDTLAMPIFLLSSRIMDKKGNTHIGKATAFYTSAVGKIFLMTNLAIHNQFHSMIGIGIDTALTLISATQSLIDHFKSNKEEITQPQNNNLMPAFFENKLDVSAKNKNILPLTFMFGIKCLTIAAMINEGAYGYAVINGLFNIGTGLTAISQQHKKNDHHPT